MVKRIRSRDQIELDLESSAEEVSVIQPKLDLKPDVSVRSRSYDRCVPSLANTAFCVSMSAGYGSSIRGPDQSSNSMIAKATLASAVVVKVDRPGHHADAESSYCTVSDEDVFVELGDTVRVLFLFDDRAASYTIVDGNENIEYGLIHHSKPLSLALLDKSLNSIAIIPIGNTFLHVLITDITKRKKRPPL